jgi:hypothetical protein
VEWTQVVGGLGVDVCTVGDESACDVVSPDGHRGAEWRQFHRFAISGVDFGARGEQGVGSTGVAEEDCETEWRETVR